MTVSLFVAPASAASPTPEEAAAAADSAWPGLVSDVFDDRPMQDGTGVVSLEAPMRAADPAVVPVKLTFAPEKKIRKVTLVIDENPSPVAATFTIGAASGLTEIETRVRVNAYTDIHAVAEAEDGTLYMVKRFVKAAGGCAAPAAKDAAAAAKSMGEMRLKRFAAEAGANGARDTAQLMIRHPNNSGLQKDQVTLLYIPAHFVSDLTVTRGADLVFAMSGGISISEDPNFRFDYDPKGDEPFTAKAVDTEGKVFEKTFAGSDS
ncbi:quinoprotein dehydrogenase-associated SoxYZ-like carrier [Aureimonas sp. Leaf454]|nr:quinoprotein dehydrogenase-associated SoxYZ-like carrier [Aureimonas sp. Leaf454]